MTVFGIAMVKNEMDVIAYTVQHMVEQVDHVVVADNLSTDKTRDILEGFGDAITILDDEDPAYRQSEKMTKLASYASDQGAKWVVPFDADEFWYPISGTSLKTTLNNCQGDIAVSNLYNFIPTDEDSVDDNPSVRMSFRLRAENPLQKVACRTHPSLIIEMGNHNARYDFDAIRVNDLITVRHYPYRSAEQFVSKAVNGAKALSLTDLPEHMGAHWRQYGAHAEQNGEESLAEIFREHFYYKNPRESQVLIFDPL